VKFKMAENSLFAVLLRSPWWVSVAIAAGLALLAVALLPAEYRVVGAVSALPFVVIGAMAARRQWRLPSTAQVSHTLQAVGRMAWPEFARQLEEAFQRQGYTVERRFTGQIEARATGDASFEFPGRLTEESPHLVEARMASLVTQDSLIEFL